MTELKHRDKEISAALALLLDRLLPGGGQWPPASEVIRDPTALFLELSDDDRHRAVCWAEEIAVLPPEMRDATLSARQESDGETFGALLRSVYWLYYTSSEVVAKITDLAESGPREASALLDPLIIQDVVRDQRGLRRL